MNAPQSLSLKDCLKPHLKAALFVSYLEYIKKNYPDVKIETLFEGTSLDESHLRDSSIWVSIKFERRFMANIENAIGKNITYEVGKFGASKEVLGKAMTFISGLLSIHDLISNIIRLTSLFNKVVKIEIEEKKFTSLIIVANPQIVGLDEEETQLLYDCMPDMMDNICGYYEALAQLKGYHTAKVTFDSKNSDTKGKHYLEFNLGVLQLSNQSLFSPLAILLVAANALCWTYGRSFFDYFLTISLSSYFYYLIKKEQKKSSSLASEGEESLNKIEIKNQKLQESNLSIERKLVEFEAVNDLLTHSMNNSTLDSILQLATTNIVGKLNYSRAFIMLKSVDESHLKFMCQTGFTGELLSKLSNFKLSVDSEKSFSEYQFSYLYQNQKSLLVNDVEAHINSLNDKESQTLLRVSGSKSFACVPIGVGTNKYGLLIADRINSDESLKFSDLKLLGNMANQIGLSIQRHELKAREQQLMDSYSKFVPFSSIKLLGHESVTDLKLGDHSEENLTVLFCDIRNFTKMCENMSPKDILLFLNSYIEHVSPPIFTNNGFIDKFIGDCIMAIFTSPKDAINAAVEMQKSLWAYNVSNRLGFRNTIDVAIGIHTGKSIFGPVGYGNKMELTVLSDNVNTASRIASLNKEFNTSILVSGDAFKDWDGESDNRYLGSVKIRGRNLPVKIYEIVPSVSDITIHENVMNADYIVHYINKVKRDLESRLEHKEELKSALILKDIDNQKEAIKYLNILKDKFEDPIIDYHLKSIQFPDQVRKAS